MKVLNQVNTSTGTYELKSERPSSGLHTVVDLLVGANTVNGIKTITEHASASSIDFDKNSFVIKDVDVNTSMDRIDGMGKIQQEISIKETRYTFDENGRVSGGAEAISDYQSSTKIALKDSSPGFQKAIRNAQTDDKKGTEMMIKQLKDPNFWIQRATDQKAEEERQHFDKN